MLKQLDIYKTLYTTIYRTPKHHKPEHGSEAADVHRESLRKDG